MKLRNSVLIGFSAACVSAILYLTGVFPYFENKIYDIFLRFRAYRTRTDNVVFLDIDDEAIAYNGSYPWPRSVLADGLLRLKEYGVLAAIIDIDNTESSPQGVDALYLNQGLANDFNGSFNEINSAAQDVFSAVKTGRADRNNIDTFARRFTGTLNDEQENLYNKARNVARDNDQYMAKTIALFGKGWSTLRLQKNSSDGEQVERLTTAQERFSYPVNAAIDANKGAGYTDMPMPLPIFSEAFKGAGFNNTEPDADGVIRRVYLAQNVKNRWYLQLAFAPLISYFGNPNIALEKNTLTIKQAKLPDGKRKDYVVPLDEKGRMMIDWSRENFSDSYKPHISFADFTLLDEIENKIDEYRRLLESADMEYFAGFDPSFSNISAILSDAGELFNTARTAKQQAMENADGESFDTFIRNRDTGFSLLAELVGYKLKIKNLPVRLSGEFPNDTAEIQEKCENIAKLIDNIEINLNNRNELKTYHDKTIRDKFCIIGRVDAGTTDYAANPFYKKFFNAGTYAAVLDTILSESFIIPVKLWIRILITLAFVPLIFFLTAGMRPVMRSVTCLLITIAFLTTTILLFRFSGIYFGPLGITFAMLGAIIVREVITFVESEKEKKIIRSEFSAYVSKDTVKELIANPSRLQLGGTKRFMTAVFTGVRNFTSISEKLDPETLVKLLNRYLSAVSGIILDEKGVIDKFEGDGVTAFFGAPLELSDHALRACVSAIKIKKIESELNKAIIEENLSLSPLVTRIGINAGYMTAGNMGTENKMNYTVIGGEVNLAARFEKLNKQYGTHILTSQDTLREAGETLLYRKLDRVTVAGIGEPVRLCELVDINEVANESDKRLITVFHQALDQFEMRNWKQAAAGFREALVIRAHDRPAKMYYDRCIQFIDNPPVEEWDGVYNIASK